jgi:hypothetical protein
MNVFKIISQLANFMKDYVFFWKFILYFVFFWQGLPVTFPSPWITEIVSILLEVYWYVELVLVCFVHRRMNLFEGFELGFH